MDRGQNLRCKLLQPSCQKCRPSRFKSLPTTNGRAQQAGNVMRLAQQKMLKSNNKIKQNTKQISTARKCVHSEQQNKIT